MADECVRRRWTRAATSGGHWRVVTFGLLLAVSVTRVTSANGVAAPSPTPTPTPALTAAATPTQVPTAFPTPTPAGVCGDLIIGGSEECDDGNQFSCDGCSATCQIELGFICGDGVIDPACLEECDDGNRIDGDGCDSNCRITRCGNGIATSGEECDDGNRLSCDGCSAFCQIEVGYYCGDGVVNAACGEQCDDGNLSSCDGCSARCQVEPGALCGDGIVNPGCEQCDDGNRLACDGCTAECQTELGLVCGDGFLNLACGEECDDGNQADDDACGHDCRRNFCGDGRLNPASEQCDDGNQTDGDGCDTNCTVTGCGNGILTGGEQCDDGNRNPFDGCTNACTQCGNGDVTAPEQCDDTNRDPRDGCTNACTRCGDGAVTFPEQCDDGNRSDGDGCNADCRLTGCPGDCDGGSSVTVDELVRGVNIALGSLAADECSSVDGNADHRVTVDELVRAVSAASNGCDAPTPSIELITNGGFEAEGGSLNGWMVVDRIPENGGSWFVQRESASPYGFPVAPPSEGTTAAMTDQGGSGTHVLIQDVAIPPATSVTLGFDLFIDNQAGSFYSPDSFDTEAGFPNQQFRVDILTPTAPALSLTDGVFAQLYGTGPDTPASTGYRRLTFDLTAFTGTTVRLRFAEADNQNYLHVGIDHVSLRIPDADGDGLSDADEMARGTDPRRTDSDGDGLDDGFEVRHGFDPLHDGDGAADADGDGLSNAQEQAAGTDPRIADSDGDALSDGAEVTAHGTDPLRPDTDGDGLDDGAEVLVHATDPLVVDTDGGGRSDGQEVGTDMTDPLDPSDDLVELIVNGGFETAGGSFTGWRVVRQPGSSGDWFVQQGTASPLSQFTIAAPPEGTFAATADETEASALLLMQEVTIPAGAPATLTFDVAALNGAGYFVVPDSLDALAGFPNQQFRIDLMDPAAPDFDVGDGVLAALFRTTDENGGIPSLYNRWTFDLSAFAGRTVRLRFAVAANQYPLWVGIDHVSVLGAPR